MNRTFVITLALAASSSARADVETAKVAYAAGEHAFNAGQLDQAIQLFKEAYEQQPEPAYLYDVAQAYRQQGDCKQALFFYKRFLWLASDNPSKPLKQEVKMEVEGDIAELEACERRKESPKPSSTPPPATKVAATHDDEDDGERDGDERPSASHDGEPKLVVAHAAIGVAKVTAGNLDTPVQLAVAATAGYPIRIADKAQLEIGPALMFTPLPYTAGSGAGAGSLFAIAADVGASYVALPKLAARVDLAAGVQVIAGLDRPGNPFTVGGAPATGPLGTFFTRLALSVDYAVTPDVLVTATPLALSYSPAPAGFMSSISSLTTLSVLVGVGYRR